MEREDIHGSRSHVNPCQHMRFSKEIARVPACEELLDWFSPISLELG
jgi:hypothetical protein